MENMKIVHFGIYQSNRTGFLEKGAEVNLRGQNTLLSLRFSEALRFGGLPSVPKCAKGKDEPMKDEKDQNPNESEDQKDGQKEKDEKDEKDAKDAKDVEKDEKDVEKDALKGLKESLRSLSQRLAKLEARLVLSERRAVEGRKVTARILAHKAWRHGRHGRHGVTGHSDGSLVRVEDMRICV